MGGQPGGAPLAAYPHYALDLLFPNCLQSEGWRVGAGGAVGEKENRLKNFWVGGGGP